MRRIAARYLYPLLTAEPVRNGFVELEEDGTVIRTGVCADPAAETSDRFDDVLPAGEGAEEDEQERDDTFHFRWTLYTAKVRPPSRSL